MQISMSVPYEEERLRRTIKFILKPQMKTIRVLGVVVAVIGLALAALDPTNVSAYACVVLGLAFMFAIGPMSAARAMRMQAKAIKDGYHMSLDDEWATVSYPLVETRFRWTGLDRITETPEVWYLTFSKMQAVAIPKAPMTYEQRFEFAAFVDRLPVANTGSPGRNG